MKKKPILKITLCFRNSPRAYWNVGCEEFGLWYSGPKDEAIARYMDGAEANGKPCTIDQYKVEYVNVYVQTRNKRSRKKPQPK